MAPLGRGQRDLERHDDLRVGLAMSVVPGSQDGAAATAPSSTSSQKPKAPGPKVSVTQSDTALPICQLIRLYFWAQMPTSSGAMSHVSRNATRCHGYSRGLRRLLSLPLIFFTEHRFLEQLPFGFGWSPSASLKALLLKSKGCFPWDNEWEVIPNLLSWQYVFWEENVEYLWSSVVFVKAVRLNPNVQYVCENNLHSKNAQ